MLRLAKCVTVAQASFPVTTVTHFASGDLKKTMIFYVFRVASATVTHFESLDIFKKKLKIQKNKK